MTLLAQHPRTLFVGQGVSCAGTAMTDTFRRVPRERLLEFPVAEELQAGFCIGLSLQGYLPVCVFPRWNFALCAANQLVNHLDRLPLYSAFRPRVIVRVAAPSKHPFDPGPQHDGDFTWAFQAMFRSVRVTSLRSAESVTPAYAQAAAFQGSSLLVEFGRLYGNQAPSGVPDEALA